MGGRRVWSEMRAKRSPQMPQHHCLLGYLRVTSRISILRSEWGVDLVSLNQQTGGHALLVVGMEVILSHRLPTARDHSSHLPLSPRSDRRAARVSAHHPTHPQPTFTTSLSEGNAPLRATIFAQLMKASAPHATPCVGLALCHRLFVGTICWQRVRSRSVHWLPSFSHSRVAMAATHTITQSTRPT